MSPAERAEARQMALHHAAEFVRDVERVKSIIRLMNDGLREDIRKAQETDDRIGAWVPEVLEINTSWLMDILDNRAATIREHLGEAGVEVGPMV